MKMSVTKVTVVLLLVLAVVSAAESKNKTAKANVVGSLLAAKARLPAVNTTLNVTGPKNSTDRPTMVRRSVGFDKSQGKSELMSIWWRIPAAIWQFLSTVLLNPLFESLRRLLALFGLSDRVIPNLPLTMPTTLPPTPNVFTGEMPQPTAPMNPEPVW